MADPSTQPREVCRFAPSTTGEAHPGTLLAALLAWLDARSRNAKFVLRLENLDPERCKPKWADAMLRDLEWLGIDWDASVVQSTQSHAHNRALDTLADLNRLYPCGVSRSEIKRIGRRSPDGGFAYPNLSRGTPLPQDGWQTSTLPLRAHLSDQLFEPREESAHELAQNPAEVIGDPVVRRRDGAFSYNLAVVVDDAESLITRVVRGHDIASSTATQLALMDLLGLDAPTYRHHLLLLEPQGDKLAKLHGSVGLSELKLHHSSEALCGVLLELAGITSNPAPLSPQEALSLFDWGLVGTQDVAVQWDEVEGQLRRL